MDSGELAGGYLYLREKYAKHVRKGMLCIKSCQEAGDKSIHLQHLAREKKVRCCFTT